MMSSAERTKLINEVNEVSGGVWELVQYTPTRFIAALFLNRPEDRFDVQTIATLIEDMDAGERSPECLLCDCSLSAKQMPARFILIRPHPDVMRVVIARGAEILPMLCCCVCDKCRDEPAEAVLAKLRATAFPELRRLNIHEPGHG